MGWFRRSKRTTEAIQREMGCSHLPNLFHHIPRKTGLRALPKGFKKDVAKLWRSSGKALEIPGQPTPWDPEKRRVPSKFSKLVQVSMSRAVEPVLYRADHSDPDIRTCESVPYYVLS